MAEKTAHLPESQNVNRSWRRISTGKLNFLYSKEKILPNYLRSMTGSSHVVCKYAMKHESEDKARVLALKRFNRSYTGTLKLDSPLRKKASTRPVLNPSLGCGKYDSIGSSDHAKTKVKNFCSRVFYVNKKNANGTKEKTKLSFSESGLADLTKPKKKMVSKSFKTIGVTRSRSKEMVEHNKRVTALKLKSVAQSAAMALRRSSVNRNKMKGETKSPELKKSIVPLTASLSSKPCSRILMSNSSSVPLTKSPKLENEKCKDLVEEKTIYVIEMKTRNAVVESDHNQGCFTKLTDDDEEKAECIFTEADHESSQEDEEEEKKVENACCSEDKSTTRQGNNRTLSTDSVVNRKSMKLKFKTVKMVDFGSQDSSPRKLPFKRGKIVIGANIALKSGDGSSLKTKGTNFSNDKEKQHQPKVVLKHQDTQNKRDSRVVLYNNVIEETANKLVETRKSKVKALVSAFESIISLQERKTCAAT